MARHCLILPAYRQAHRVNLRCIDELQRLSPATRVEPEFGGPNVCHVRSILASEAMRQPEEVHLWIDDDSVFSPGAALSLVDQCSDVVPIIGANYAVTSPGSGQLTACLVPGDEGAVRECYSLGFGLVAVHSSVLRKMAARLPTVTIHGAECKPFFQSAYDPERNDFPSSDIAFCRFARSLELKVFCDTRVRVGHAGQYVYHVEDAFTKVSAYH